MSFPSQNISYVPGTSYVAVDPTGSAPTVAGLSVYEGGAGPIRQTKFVLNGVSVSVTDSGGATGAHGNLKIYDFPAGAILMHGGAAKLTVTAATGIDAGAALVWAVGTTATATDNATLTTTEANIIPSTAATLTSSTNTSSQYTATAAGILNGTATAIDGYLNVAVPDAGATANSTVTVTGEIVVTWIQLGDPV
jgi:hypothetical protein